MASIFNRLFGSRQEEYVAPRAPVFDDQAQDAAQPAGSMLALQQREEAAALALQGVEDQVGLPLEDDQKEPPKPLAGRAQAVNLDIELDDAGLVMAPAPKLIPLDLDGGLPPVAAGAVPRVYPQLPPQGAAVRYPVVVPLAVKDVLVAPRGAGPTVEEVENELTIAIRDLELGFRLGEDRIGSLREQLLSFSDANLGNAKGVKEYIALNKKFQTLQAYNKRMPEGNFKRLTLNVDYVRRDRVQLSERAMQAVALHDHISLKQVHLEAARDFVVDQDAGFDLDKLPESRLAKWSDQWKGASNSDILGILQVEARVNGNNFALIKSGDSLFLLGYKEDGSISFFNPQRGELFLFTNEDEANIVLGKLLDQQVDMRAGSLRKLGGVLLQDVVAVGGQPKAVWSVWNRVINKPFNEHASDDGVLYSFEDYQALAKKTSQRLGVPVLDVAGLFGGREPPTRETLEALQRDLQVATLRENGIRERVKVLGLLKRKHEVDSKAILPMNRPDKDQVDRVLRDYAEASRGLQIAERETSFIRVRIDAADKLLNGANDEMVHAKYLASNLEAMRKGVDDHDFYSLVQESGRVRLAAHEPLMQAQDLEKYGKFLAYDRFRTLVQTINVNGDSKAALPLAMRKAVAKLIGGGITPSDISDFRKRYQREKASLDVPELYGFDEIALEDAEA